MKIVISSGHGKLVRGASGYLDEVDEARRVVNRVADLLDDAGLDVEVFHDDISTSQSENLNRIVSYHNSQGPHDLDVSVHFNAYQTTTKPMGTEVLYVTQASLAGHVSEAIADAGDFPDRGGKKRTDLAFLNGTTAPAILIETCFVDSSSDQDQYNSNFEGICEAIAESISGEEVVPQPPDPPSPTPPETPKTGLVYGLQGNDLLNIRAEASSSSTAIGTAQNGDRFLVVGSTMNGDTKWLRCSFGEQCGRSVSIFGWVSAQYVRVRGSVPDDGDEVDTKWHTNITATEFGGHDDPQDSAYGDGPVDGDAPGVALPYKWRDGPRPTIIVEGPQGQLECPPVDVGPWNTDDPNYVLHGHRPLSEQQYQDRVPAQNGMVPSNDAGIDLTPYTAARVGVSGKGKVRWRILED